MSKGLHWLMAFLILLAIILGWTAELLPVSPVKLDVFVFHKTIGITLLMLVLIRLIWRLLNPPPEPVPGLSKTNELLAKLGHLGLYLLLIAMPLSGWIMNSAANFPFQWFGLFTVPHLTGKDEALEAQAALVHLILFWVLAVVVLGHASMAIIHHVKHKNDVLIRMLPESLSPKRFLYSGLTLILVTAVGLALVINTPGTSPETQTVERAESGPAVSEPVKPGPAAETMVTTVPAKDVWAVLPDESVLGFIGDYSGVEFNGEFKAFTALIRFDPEDPEAGLFDVSIDTTSVTTFNDEWDGYLSNNDWFHFDEYPVSRYTTKSITVADGNNFIAIGTLDLKGTQKDVALRFTWHEYPDGKVQVEGQARMLAEADINRIEFGIGEGFWQEDETIGFNVIVKVDLLLTPDNNR